MRRTRERLALLSQVRELYPSRATDGPRSHLHVVDWLIDGREAVTFLVALKNAIEDPTRILIDL